MRQNGRKHRVVFREEVEEASVDEQILARERKRVELLGLRGQSLLHIPR